MHAGIPRQAGYKKFDPNYVPAVIQVASLINLLTVPKPNVINQSSITDFFTKGQLFNPSGVDSITSLSTGSVPRLRFRRIGTAPKKGASTTLD